MEEEYVERNSRIIEEKMIWQTDEALEIGKKLGLCEEGLYGEKTPVAQATFMTSENHPDPDFIKDQQAFVNYWFNQPGFQEPQVVVTRFHGWVNLYTEENLEEGENSWGVIFTGNKALVVGFGHPCETWVWQLFHIETV